MTAHLHPSPEHFAPARTLTVGHSAFTATSGQPSPHTLHFAPVPKDYAAALQVVEQLGHRVQDARARVAAARDGVYPATVAYLKACDSGTPESIGWTKHDLRQCVLRAQEEERLLLSAEAEHQKAARLAESLLARGAA